MLFRILRRSIGEMKKDNVITVVRLVIGLTLWYLSSFIFKTYFASAFPAAVAPVLSSMVVPYTAGLGLFLLATFGMPKSAPAEDGLSAAYILKAFVVQNGIAFPLMIASNMICMLLFRIKSEGMGEEQLFGGMWWFYAVLLLVFNPVFEELLYRKLVIDRLSGFDNNAKVICSALLFAVPHVLSVGVPAMFFAFGMGLVWGFVYTRQGKLWPAVLLHALGNLMGSYIPLALSLVHPACQVLFIMCTVGVCVPLTVVILTYKKKG